MKLILEVTIPGRVGILKNSKKLVRLRKSNRMIPIASDKYLAWHQGAFLCVKSAFKRGGGITNLGPVLLKAEFHFKNHAHEPDLSNCYQGVEDILESVGVIENDRQIIGHDGSRKIFMGEDKTVVRLYGF